jgi:hypothetical protein
LLTAGRLAHGYGQTGLYGIRYDPAAVQFVLNMLQAALNSQAEGLVFVVPELSGGRF